MTDARTSKGKLFHNLGPEIAKARPPLDLRRALGIVNSNLFKDLSDTFALYGLINFQNVLVFLILFEFCFN